MRATGCPLGSGDGKIPDGSRIVRGAFKESIDLGSAAPPPIPPFRQSSVRHHRLPQPVATLDRKPPVAVGGSVFLRCVGSDQGSKNLEKALDGAARAEGLRGDAGAFAQEEQFVGEQLGIA